MTDITHCKKVYVSTSKSADYVSAVDHDGAVEFVRADSVQALVDALRVAADILMDYNNFTGILSDTTASAAARAALKQWEDGE